MVRPPRRRHEPPPPPTAPAPSAPRVCRAPRHGPARTTRRACTTTRRPRPGGPARAHSRPRSPRCAFRPPPCGSTPRSTMARASRATPATSAPPPPTSSGTSSVATSPPTAWWSTPCGLRHHPSTSPATSTAAPSALTYTPTAGHRPGQPPRAAPKAPSSPTSSSSTPLRRPASTTATTRAPSAGYGLDPRFYREMDKVFTEVHASSSPAGCFGLYASCSDYFEIQGLRPRGAPFSTSSGAGPTPSTSSPSPATTKSLQQGDWHLAAARDNFFLRGFNYLFSCVSPPRRRLRPRRTRPATVIPRCATRAQRGPHDGATPQHYRG